MKILLPLISVALLAGCATQAPRPAYYGTRAPQTDPSQWQVVSVTPVAPGTGERVAAQSGSGQAVEYSSTPATTTYVTQPVYVQQPVYVPQPVYVDPYPYYVGPSIGWGIALGRSWGHRGRSWGSVGIGSRW
jgi:hypothetical protein